MSATFCQRRRSIAAVSALVAMLTSAWLAGCATDRLDSAAPAGVDISGDWRLDTNLSDDAQTMPADGDRPARTRPRGGRGGPGGGARLSPLRLPGEAGGRTERTSSGDVRSLTDAPGANPGGAIDAANSGIVRTLWQSSAAQEDGAATDRHAPAQSPDGSQFGNLLEAPVRMSIEQKRASVTIRGRFAGGRTIARELVPGGKTSIPFGRGHAELSAGWRGNIFVIVTRVRSGPTREEDYALDEQGHLIVSTFVSGAGARKSEIKRVYDRISVGPSEDR